MHSSNKKAMIFVRDNLKVFCGNGRPMWQSHRQLRSCNQGVVLLEEWNTQLEIPYSNLILSVWTDASMQDTHECQVPVCHDSLTQKRRSDHCLQLYISCHH